MECCEIICILDRSGSMASIKKDMEGGFNQFVKDQQKLPGEAFMTFVQFDSSGVDRLFTSKAIADVGPMQIIPNGMTPLFDAVGETISKMSLFVGGKVIVLIITDGQENASKEWTASGVKNLIEAHKAKGWEFHYLGANVGAFDEASKLGVAAANTANYHAGTAGVAGMMRGVSMSVARSRAGEDSAYTQEEREGMNNG